MDFAVGHWQAAMGALERHLSFHQGQAGQHTIPVGEPTTRRLTRPQILDQLVLVGGWTKSSRPSPVGSSLKEKVASGNSAWRNATEPLATG